MTVEFYPQLGNELVGSLSVDGLHNLLKLLSDDFTLKYFSINDHHMLSLRQAVLEDFPNFHNKL